MLVDLIGLKQMHSTTRYHKETAALQFMLTLGSDDDVPASCPFISLL